MLPPASCGWLKSKKSLAQLDNEGIARRVISTLLTWMAERSSKVFIAATSNDITRLPPELIRKGRLDEMFFVDLSNQVDRAGMVDIHLHKRDLSLTQEEANKVADAIASFTTAEIKQSVVSSLYKARAQNEALILEYYLSVVSSTMPISITRAEAVKQLRDWPILEPFVPISRY